MKTVLTISITAVLGLFGFFMATSNPTLPALAGSTTSGSNLWNRTELYFGSGKPDGSSVTEKQFREFVDREVTPRFPNGLTLLTGYGQFRNSSGKVVKEQAFVLVLLYQVKAENAKLERIRSI